MKTVDRYNLSIFLQLFIVLSSIFGSLFFSEVMKFAPCNLCWYQRLCVYPMSYIILTGLFLKSSDTVKYLLPFSVSGLFISIYHNFVYYKFITVIVPCTESAPCSAQQLNWLGFVTIPMLSFLTFFLLLALNIMTIMISKKIEAHHEK